MSHPTCEMIVGYLVPHKCDNRAVGKCGNCSRQFCDEHLNLEKSGLICTACQQGLDQPVAIADNARNFTDDDLAAFKTAALFDDSFNEGDIFSDLS